MPAIQVQNLRKTFTTKRKAAGLGGSLRALVRPERQTQDAVRGLSFEMEAGELLGFIGPNGAGKSTTIKILTGILHPTGGQAEVLARYRHFLSLWQNLRAGRPDHPRAHRFSGRSL